MIKVYYMQKFNKKFKNKLTPNDACLLTHTSLDNIVIFEVGCYSLSVKLDLVTCF